MVGSGDGIVRVYYDPERSVRGAKLCMVKKRTEAKQVFYRKIFSFLPENWLLSFVRDIFL